MRTSNKISLAKRAKSNIIDLSAILLATTAAPAFAQQVDAPGAITVSGNAAVTSDYRFRGLSFSDGDIAIQGGIDVAHQSGFYIGAWGSSIEDSPTFGHTELDIYGGWSGEIMSGLTLDTGLLYYFFPNGEDGVAGPSDYFEPYASVAGSIGPVEVKSGIAYAWNQASLGNSDNVYIYTGVSAGVPNTPLTVNANIGVNDGALCTPASIVCDNDYVDWMLGVDWAVTNNLTATLAYTDTDAPPINNFTDSAVVFTLGISF